MEIRIGDVIIKKGINPRKKLRDELIQHYSEIFDLLPPVVVQKGTGVLIDGFHRIEAAKFIKREAVDVVEMDIPDNELFAEACRRNNTHGLPLSKDERNEAIVKLYKDGGYKQEALGQMWGITHSQVGYILGANERTKKMSPGDKKQKLTPKHEQIIRRAPEPIQNKIAEVVLTREVKPEKNGSASKKKLLTVAQTNALVKTVSENPEETLPKLEHLLEHPEECNIVGVDDNGSIERDSINQIIANVKSEPGIAADWAGLMLNLAEFRNKYNLQEISSCISTNKHGLFSIERAIDFFEQILVMLNINGGQNGKQSTASE